MKISAIVPVYNTEDLVGRCIESILAQSFLDWELILIDDGSKDGSLGVLKTYEKKDSRIKVIHQDNSGPGLARNRGIKEATGEYVVFVDSDDAIMSDYFEKLSKEIADVVFIDIDQVDNDLNLIRKEHMSDYKNLSKDDFIRSQINGTILWGGVRKAAKRQLLLDNNILFTDHKVGEEAIYSFLLLYYARSIAFITGSVYQYINRDGSQSDLKDDDPWGDVALALRNTITDLHVYDQYADTVNSFFATATIVSIDKLAQKYKYKFFRQKAKLRLDKYFAEIDMSHNIDKAHMAKKARLMLPFINRKLVFPLYIASKGKSLIKKAMI